MSEVLHFCSTGDIAEKGLQGHRFTIEQHGSGRSQKIAIYKKIMQEYAGTQKLKE